MIYKYFQVDCYNHKLIFLTHFLSSPIISSNEGKLAGNLQSSKGNLDQGSRCCTDGICTTIQETNLGFSNGMILSIGLHTSAYL